MPQERTFIGRRESDGATIYVRDGVGQERELALRLDLRNHSPTGVEWGYAGSGPAQAALAICATVTDDETALQVYQQVKVRLIATIPQMTSHWELSESEVRAEIERVVAARG